METQAQRKPVDWALVTMFAAGLLLGGGAAAWAVLHVKKAPAAAVAPASAPVKSAAPVQAHAHVPCPPNAVIGAASRDDGLARLKNEPNTPAEIAGVILAGKESAAAGRPRDAEVIFLAACKAADRLQRADAAEPIEARYQLARHYAHYLQVGSAPAAGRVELARRAELLYTDSVQAYGARYGADHEKTRFASDGLAALRQSQTQPQVMATAQPAPASAAPRAIAVKAVAVPVIEAKPRPPVVVAKPVPPQEPVVAEAPRPRRAARAPAPEPAAEPEVIEAPVRQATGASTAAQ